MTKEEKVTLQLTRAGNGGQLFRIPQDIDYNLVGRQISEQAVACLAFDGLQRTVDAYGRDGIPKSFVLQLYGKRMATVQAMGSLREKMSDFATRMQPHRCIVLKGIDYASYWPQPLYREFDDLDCWCDDGADNINRLSREIGARVETGTCKHNHIFYNDLVVENHVYLTDYDGTAKCTENERLLQQLLHETPAQPLEETGLFSPNMVFTAVFMLKHAQQHFLLEGIGLRHFLDWMYFVDKVSDKLDWERVYNILDTMRLHSFADMMTAYCVTRLGWQPPCKRITMTRDERLLCRVDRFIFSAKADVENRNVLYIIRRLANRFARIWQFRTLHHQSVPRAIWTSLAYASIFNRHPKE